MFTHETVREWEAKLAPLIAEQLRTRRQGVVGESWYVDETYIKVDGRWCYLYRAIDRSGHLVDVRLSETRDLVAAKAFFRWARAVTGVVPDRVTSDGHSPPRAIAGELGEDVTHRTNQYLNNHLEQDHRGIKQRVRPTPSSSASPRRPGSAVPMISCETSCALPPLATKKSHWLDAGSCMRGVSAS